MNYSTVVLQIIWEKADEIPGEDPLFWRQDSEGRYMYFYQYGDKTHAFGWVVGFIKSFEDGGSDEHYNLQAENWVTNKEKASRIS